MDGETIVLGGLISKLNNRLENKIPWLGDLPYCGALFRYRTQTQEKRELLVVLTPHVIRNSADAEKRLMEEARRMSWVLRDVDRLYGAGGQPPCADGSSVLPPGVWAGHPDGGAAIAAPGEHGAHARDPAGQEWHGAALVHAQAAGAGGSEHPGSRSAKSVRVTEPPGDHDRRAPSRLRTLSCRANGDEIGERSGVSRLMVSISGG